VYSALTEYEETLHKLISDACHTIHNCPRTFEMVHQSTTRHTHASIDQVEDILAHVVNCDLINNKNSTVIKFGTFTSMIHDQPIRVLR
jgi:hypothetical protein